jgi:predicted HicB family RNase H-like nuclease
MQQDKPKRPTKTFPLEIEDDLHKALKVKAIEEDKTLHSLIIEALSDRVQEGATPYHVNKVKGGKK